MRFLQALWIKAIAEWRGNPRLRYGMIAIALVLVVEGGLRWSDAITRQQTELARLQTELATLRSNARDEATLRATLEKVQGMAQALDERLWTVSSEAVGQARLKDWLTEIVQRSIADQYLITLAGSRELDKPSKGGGNATVPVREFRANVSFRLTPRALEGVLLEIEGGEPLAAVETLVARKQERRVTLTVRVLMRVQEGGHV